MIFYILIDDRFIKYWFIAANIAKATFCLNFRVVNACGKTVICFYLQYFINKLVVVFRDKSAEIWRTQKLPFIICSHFQNSELFDPQCNFFNSATSN